MEHIITINTEEETGLVRKQQEIKSSFTSSTPRSDEMKDAVKLVSLINEKLNKVDSCTPSKFCIYRVRQVIRQLNEKAYEPRVISIGPYHYGDVRFKSMELFKMRNAKKVIDRSGVGLETYVEFLQSIEENVRQCYSDIVEMDSDDFVTMLLVDGCFIIELLMCYYDKNFIDFDFWVLSEARLCEDIHLDLMLLENQIPFFVLEGLFNLGKSIYHTPLLKLAVWYYRNHNPQMKTHDEIGSIHHFTDLLLMFHRPVSRRINTKEYHRSKTATELYDAGVKFVMGSSKCLLDIKFDKGIIEIPLLKLDDNSELIFRNMIALEHCHYTYDCYIQDYFYFIDYLVNTHKDVDLLTQSGVVNNWLGNSTQAADLINDMCKHVPYYGGSLFFCNLFEKLNAYCKIPKHRWRATLKRDYLSSPWRIASTSAAIILLLLTLTQTVCSLLATIR